MNPLQFARMIVIAQNKVVEYAHGATICPVCRELGLVPGKTTVTCTCKDVRYLTCDQCLSTFRAIGDERIPVKAPLPAVVKSPDTADKVPVKKHNKNVRNKGKTKNGDEN
jgi:hypothetical protein